MDEENLNPDLNPDELKIPAYQRRKIKSDYSNLIDHPQIPKEDEFYKNSHQNKKILVLNSGSSSIKAKVFEKEINNPDNLNSLQEIKSFHLEDVEDHEQGIRKILNQLLEEEVIISYDEIIYVGHRVVHGGEKFQKASIIDEKNLADLEELSELAPLHNPINIEGIKICKKIFSESTKQIAVFDTAFHQTMEEKAYLYGLSKEIYEKYKIRRYGFHGTSHKYVINRALDFLKKSNFEKKLDSSDNLEKENNSPIKINSYYLSQQNHSKNQEKLEHLKIISCHLGNGSSITASINGKSIDTSMGFTPLEGVMMGTRSGSIDPAIPTFLIKNHNYTSTKVEELLNHKSGLGGFSEISNSMKEIYETSESLNQNKERRDRAKLTIETLAYQIAKYCGGYAAAMNGLDCLIFTGGMGENAFYLRQKICQYLAFLGLKFDEIRNKESLKYKSNFDNQIQEISLPASKITTLVIKTDEEKQIALECLEI